MGARVDSRIVDLTELPRRDERGFGVAHMRLSFHRWRRPPAQSGKAYFILSGLRLVAAGLLMIFKQTADTRDAGSYW
jgi:hypothetical protein